MTEILELELFPAISLSTWRGCSIWNAVIYPFPFLLSSSSTPGSCTCCLSMFSHSVSALSPNTSPLLKSHAKMCNLNSRDYYLINTVNLPCQNRIELNTSFSSKEEWSLWVCSFLFLRKKQIVRLSFSWSWKIWFLSHCVLDCYQAAFLWHQQSAFPLSLQFSHHWLRWGGNSEYQE